MLITSMILSKPATKRLKSVDFFLFINKRRINIIIWRRRLNRKIIKIALSIFKIFTARLRPHAQGYFIYILFFIAIQLLFQVLFKSLSQCDQQHQKNDYWVNCWYPHIVCSDHSVIRRIKVLLVYTDHLSCHRFYNIHILHYNTTRSPGSLMKFRGDMTCQPLKSSQSYCGHIGQNYCDLVGI